MGNNISGTSRGACHFELKKIFDEALCGGYRISYAKDYELS
jgi:hypothetical protein